MKNLLCAFLLLFGCTEVINAQCPSACSGRNTFLGQGAGANITTGDRNTFVGSDAGNQTTIGEFNTFIGRSSGRANVDGSYNTFLGLSSGRNNLSGSNNVFLGQEAGYENLIGSGNVFLGLRAGYYELGSNKLYIANDSAGAPLVYGEFDNQLLRINGDLEVTGSINGGGLGSIEGLTIDASNTFIGDQSGLNTSGNFNVFVGAQAGRDNTLGSGNTFIGDYAGRRNVNGEDNTFIGENAGVNNTTGRNNVFIGKDAGAGNVTGNGNVFIGRSAGMNANTSNKLYIDNDSTDEPLIYGDFEKDEVTIHGALGVGLKNPERPIHLRATNAIFRIDRDRDDPGFAIVRYDNGFNNVWKSFYFYTNADGVNDGKFVIADWGTNVKGASTPRLVIANNGNVGIGNYLFSNPSQKLTVDGNTLTFGSFISSDKRYKKNIRPIQGALDLLGQMQGVSYGFDQAKFADRNLPDGKTLGLIAQEVEKVLPELVVEDGQGYKAVNYDAFVPILIEALKEQNQKIKSLEEQLTIKNATQELEQTETITGPAQLYQNQPNPFDEITSIKMYLPEGIQQATLYIYNMQGQTLKKIEVSQRGETTIDIAGNTLTSGMYLYALIADNEEVDVKRMILK